MSRRPRLWYPGAIYHITSRGNRKSVIFNDQSDYQKYLTCVAETRNEIPFHLHGYCLMPNHLHLLLETESIHIQRIMWSFQTSYANYFNKKYNLEGHVFQGRYGSKMIDSQKYFVDANRYIHLNPVKAELVENPSEYEWGSYQYYVNGNPPPYLNTTKTISLFPSLSSYQIFVERTTITVE
ncbi:REP-associated tyrosine transposase [Bacillus sp. DJP31]|uniref:REP-associated tyrosine transposase n=1 Tax=Bacillus sp. DJP31 TaxID=3409789 RepID=UPI003BB55B49